MPRKNLKTSLNFTFCKETLKSPPQPIDVTNVTQYQSNKSNGSLEILIGPSHYEIIIMPNNSIKPFLVPKL